MPPDCQDSSHHVIGRGKVLELIGGPSLSAGEVRHADQPGVLAKLGHPNLGDRSVAARGQLRLERLPGRGDHQLSRLGHPATEDEHSGIEDRREVGHALAEPGPDAPEGLDGDWVSLPGGLGDL
jgi:hypothetical protein